MDRNRASRDRVSGRMARSRPDNGQDVYRQNDLVKPVRCRFRISVLSRVRPFAGTRAGSVGRFHGGTIH